MTVLAIIETNITDPSWIEAYTKEVTPMVLDLGGRYLTRTDNIELLEGDEKPQFSVVVEFPSKEVALGFYHSKEYEPYKKARHAGSTSKFLLVPIENGAE
ncbi:DUF1330 domain-containing protein [Marinomonas transparens]|uniref:DUF1330 domain-containing protein n=1 Tax=Marinomonas transparens TaxID=2795388 RepID=A0A934MWD1_9GAMM|nr:DUF1330 domain-containing protein [Marinomonas transparens]MBJ7538044.1 DUF1330 domain-containing protein [Marinomonas transparens]